MEGQDSELISNSIPKKQYRKPSSIANAAKAREGRARVRQQMKSRPPSEDEYSEDEIVYVPTRRKAKKDTEQLKPPEDPALKHEVEELKKLLEQLKTTKSEPIPIPVHQPKPQHHHDVINMAKSRILNF